MELIYSLVVIAAYIFAFWAIQKAYEAKDEADRLYNEGIKREFDKLTDNVRYMSFQDYEHAVQDFQREWTGRVSKERLRQYVRSLEEWPSIYL
jgi:hypothetical protein